MSLIDKIRRARENNVEVDGKRFTIRRPTDEEALLIDRAGSGMIDIVKRFTVGWSLVELDLIPGGGPEPVPFSSDLFAEWVADRPEVWEPLGRAITDAYQSHADKRKAAVKN